MGKYLFGSHLLKLKCCRDEDWLTFVDKPPKELERGERSIRFNNIIISHFIEGNNRPEDVHKSYIMYQLSKGFFEGDENYPFKHFNILEHKEVWINQLKGWINLPETEERALSKDFLPKQFYHILYQYYMITENVHFISEEAKVDVQKIHDFEMPTSYFYELRDMINSL